MPRRPFSSYLALIVVTLFSCGVSAQDELAPEIETIFAAQEHVATSYRWNFDCVVLRLKPEHVPDKELGIQATFTRLKSMSRAEVASQYEVNPEAHRSTGSFMFDSLTDRFLVDSIYTGKSSNEQWYATSNGWGFDGKNYSRFECFEIDPDAIAELRMPGAKLLPILNRKTTGKKQRRGHIESQLADGDQFPHICGVSGLYFFPHFCSPLHVISTSQRSLGNQRRSHYLRTLAQKHDVHVCEVDPALIGLTYVVKHEVTEKGRKFTSALSHSTVLFDKSKGGAIASLAHHLPGKMNESTLWTEVFSKEIEPGVWLPSEVTQISAYGGIGSRINITRVESNPALDSSSFNYQMPPGTLVIDEVAGKEYTVPFDPPVTLDETK